MNTLVCKEGSYTVEDIDYKGYVISLVNSYNEDIYSTSAFAKKADAIRDIAAYMFRYNIKATEGNKDLINAVNAELFKLKMPDNTEPMYIGNTHKPRYMLEQAYNMLHERSEEKERQYGPFAEGIKKAAAIATAMGTKEITEDDVYNILIALKLSRESYTHKEDNILDAVVYLAQLNEVRNKR